MALRLLATALLALAAVAPAAPAASPRLPEIRVDPGVAEHTVTAFTIERGGVAERDERVETWVAAGRAKVVYTDARTGETLGACAGTRRLLRCFDRRPAEELAAGTEGRLFEPSWAESGRSIRRALARGWLTQTASTDHRGIAARRLVSTPTATGDPGDTVVVVERETLSVLFRQTRAMTPEGLTSTEDVLVRERLRARDVDFRLNAPEGSRVRSRALKAPRRPRP